MTPRFFRDKEKTAVKGTEKVSDKRSRIEGLGDAGGGRGGGWKKAQERLEWRSTRESRDYSRINSLLVHVGTGVGFYELVWAVVSTIEQQRERKENIEQILRELCAQFCLPTMITCEQQ